MGTRTTLIAFCCISFVILSTTALNVNNTTEDKVEDTGIEVTNEELEVGTKKTVEELPAAQQLAVQNHEEEVKVDAAENADETLTSFNVKDTDGRSKFINNQYIPDDFSNNRKPLFELLQEETNQQNPPKPLATRYNNFDPSTVLYDKFTAVKEKNTFKLPKPTKLPNYFSRPIPQSSKAQNKGPIKFKTVSASSQFIATPAANLLLKLEIGIAKPSQSIDDDDTMEIYQ